MSNPLAIRAVTQTLRRLLIEDDFIDAVSVRPPDRLLEADAMPRLNLYLYRVSVNSSWSNLPLPDRGTSEREFPPLALDLHYLLTAYGDESEACREHEMLGRAMSILHSNAYLSPGYIRRHTRDISSGQYNSDLHEQIEKVHITHDPLSVDELSKLWNTFQTQYRISTSYRVSVVLIDSTRAPKNVQPVLRRGEDDRGVKVFVGLEPRLSEIFYRHNGQPDMSQSGAGLGDDVDLTGVNLPAQGLSVTIRDPKHPESPDPDANIVRTIPIKPQPKADHLEFNLSKDLAQWQAGIYTVEVSFDRDGETRRTNPLPFAIVPEILRRADERPVVSNFREDDRRKLQVEIVNGVNQNRRAFLILSGQGHAYQLARDLRSAENLPEAPVFDVDKVPPGKYRMRIRIDGVDSLQTLKQRDPAKRYQEFDPNLVINVQA